MKLKLFSLFFLAIALTSNAFAHDEKLHKGKPTEGTVSQLTQNGFDLKTETNSVSVKYGENVTFEGEKEGSAKKEDLQSGSHVSVFGTKLASGELVAKEIHIHSSQHQGETHLDVSHQEHSQGK